MKHNCALGSITRTTGDGGEAWVANQGQEKNGLQQSRPFKEVVSLEAWSEERVKDRQ
jgi:hypothetical protein